MDAILNKLQKNIGKAKHFTLKSGEEIAAGIHKIDEANKTVKFIHGAGLKKLKDAENEGKSVEYVNKIMSDASNFSILPFSDISNVF